MVTGKPEVEGTESIDSSSKERADKRTNPSPTKNKTANSCHVSTDNHEVLKRIKAFEMWLIQKKGEAGIHACCCSELS